MSDETRQKISQALKKYKKTPEHRNKLSSAQSGKSYSDISRQKMSDSHHGERPWRQGIKIPGMTDEKHPNWVGDKVGYSALHAWVSRKKGKPETCEHCGTNGLTGQSIHWANKSHEYKRDLSDWIRLCVSCHRIYDYSYERNKYVTH